MSGLVGWMRILEIAWEPSKPGDLVRVPNPAVPGNFSVSNLIFQARYRWEVAPLSELFIVMTIQANQTRALGDSTWNDSLWVQFSDALSGGSSIYPMNTTSGLDSETATAPTDELRTWPSVTAAQVSPPSVVFHKPPPTAPK